MRVLGQIPDPCEVDSTLPMPLPEAPRLHRLLGDRQGNQAEDIRDRLGSVGDKHTWPGMFTVGVVMLCVHWGGIQNSALPIADLYL